jgi:hypothetical protein
MLTAAKSSHDAKEKCGEIPPTEHFDNVLQLSTFCLHQHLTKTSSYMGNDSLYYMIHLFREVLVCDVCLSEHKSTCNNLYLYKI